jgi:hypothetical protein
VLFDAEEALLELRRLGLLRERCVPPGTSDPGDDIPAEAGVAQSQQQQGAAGGWLQAAGVAGRPASPAEMLSTVIERLWSSNGRAKGLQGRGGRGSRSASASQPRAVAGKVPAAQGTANGRESSSSSDRRRTAPSLGSIGVATPSRSRSSKSSTGGSQTATASTSSTSSSSSRDDEGTQAAGPLPEGSEVQYAVVGRGDARQVLQTHWADLLDRRVDSIVAGLGVEGGGQGGVRHGPLASSGSRRDK